MTAFRESAPSIRSACKVRTRVRAFLRAASVSMVFATAASLVVPDARAAFNNETARGTFAGTHNYVITGNTLRTQSNNGNACAVGSSSSATVSGIPGGSTILAAYLYWGGSGNVDANVTFAGNNLTADATFTDNFQTFLNNQDYDLDYFGGFEDVTPYVSGNGSYTFSGLTVATTDNYGGNPDADYCGPEAVIAGWALVVFYSNPSEPYRYTRIYDGLRYFRGSSVTTTQTGFRVPDLQDGKVSIVTWEGDPDVGETASSHPLDGFTEALSFDSQPLLNAGCDGTDNLYNSTIGNMGASCNSSSWGLDIDTYDITDHLYEGQTGAVLDYSSGNDLVFLTAQVISTTNTPVADLGISKTHNGSHFVIGQNGSYDIVVHNYGPEIATGTATVTDTLPTGLTYVSGTGTGWTCSAVGQVVTCNNSQTTLAIGADLPTLTLTVAVDVTAAASTDNTAEVSHPMFDGTGGNQTDTDTVSVRGSNLSTSTKSVLDIDGGDVEEGDVLRYTITVTETGSFGIGASGVTVVDDLPAKLNDLQVISIPAGSVNESVGSGGANGTGQVKVTGITVPSGGSAQVVFEATVSGGPVDDEVITNTAVITSTSGPGGSPSVPVTVSVPGPEPPADGTKYLYAYNNLTLTRVPQTANSTSGVEVEGANDLENWNLTAPVATGKSLVIPAQNVQVRLVTRASGNSTGNNRNVRVELRNNGALMGSATVGVSGTTNTLRTWSIPVGNTTILAGNQLQMRVVNTVNQSNRDIIVVSRQSGTNYSRLYFLTDTVINVDEISTHTAIYPTVNVKGLWNPGDVVYIRANISDPFGGYDVTGARLTLTDGNGTTVVNDLAMTARTSPSNNGTPNRIYEYAYTIPASPNFGEFTATVTATEGTETAPTITHVGTKKFTVEPKALQVVKSHSGDFIAGANNAYTLTVSNTDVSTVSGTTTVKDTLATGLSFVSGVGTGWSCSAAGQVVTCTSSASIPASSSMAPITLTVFVAGNMGSAVNNQASVGNSTIAGGFQKPGNVDPAIIRHPDLSTSTKTVQDLNGGDANPGDTLRYTVTVIESAGYPANSVTVSDTLPYGLGAMSGLHASSTCNGTPSIVGSTLTVTGMSVFGGGSCTLVFDVAVSGSSGAGLVIDNTATISNPAGNGAAPHVAITVAQSQVTNPLDKVLYVYANNTMTRVEQSSASNNTINENSYQDFILSNLGGALTISPGSTINVYAWLRRSGSTTTTTRSVYARLFKNGGTQVGSTSNTVNFTSTTAARQLFTITAPSFGTAGNLVPGDTLTLRVYNSSGSGGNDRTVRFDQLMTGSATTDDSRVTISTPTVVNVGNVSVYSQPWPSMSQVASHGQGETIFIRATVTDPFGFADITGGSITIRNPSNTIVTTATLVNGTHTVGTPAGATRIYEYAYTIPGGAPSGAWTASVKANEGSEGTITHTGNGGFNVGGRVTLRKVWGAGAIAGDTVSLTISGGTSPVGGSSTAPSTLTDATANAAAGATITLTEAFLVGSAASYTVSLACTKDSDLTTVTPSGTGLSRTITMPAGSVTCTYTNGLTVPLTIIKSAVVYSDPINGTTNPKAIPGALVTYLLILIAPAQTEADADSIIISDPIPPSTALFVDDMPDQPGNSPIASLLSTSNLTLTFGGLGDMGDDVEFSDDGGATWTYVPVIGSGGVDPAVTNLRFKPKGTFSPGGNIWIGFRVMVE